MDPQDQTFMTIHNLTPEANILFASESVLDILGYQPDEVLNKSCFDYFHPDEVPLARSVHSRGVRLDKAAVLHYARIRAKDGRWVSCECCFTIVHDVLVASTSIYKGDAKSEGRAMIAPRVRRLFSSSPRDPRYHMLEHLSPRFKMPPTEREPRAALVLNRFTRNLSIMFATNAVTSILGLRPDELLHRPFYHCIQQNCLADAIACLESAKKNESIAYLRFWYRDPRQDDCAEPAEEDGDDDSTDMDSEDDSDERENPTDDGMDVDDVEYPPRARERCTSIPRHRPNATRQMPTPPPSDGAQTPLPNNHPGAFELEAVVSCTSDGLVVVLRRARPPIPDAQLPVVHAQSLFNYEKGLFAAPWTQQPIMPRYPPEMLYTFRAPFRPEFMPLQEHVKAAGGPPDEQLLESIREVAVFTWAVVGINGNIATFGRGEPGRGAQPSEGLPVWDPNAGSTSYQGPENQAISRGFQTTRSNTARDGQLHGYDTSCAAHRPSIQRYSSAPASSTLPREHHAQTADGFSQATGTGTLDGQGFHRRHSDLRCGDIEQDTHRNSSPRRVCCDCPARQQCIDAAIPRVHNHDCASLLAAQAHYRSSRDVRRQYR